MAERPDETADELRWSVWPARQRPHAAAAALALVLGVSWYGYAGFGSLVYSVVALVVLLVSLAAFLFPSAYRLDAEGVDVSGLLHHKRKAWADLGCFLRGQEYIAVSTTPEPTERSISHGFILRLEGNGDEVAAYLARHLPPWKRPEANGEADEHP